MFYQKKIVFFLFLLFLFVVFSKPLMVYAAEISGDLEIGEKSYSDILSEDDDYGEITEELVDRYHYTRFWLKYRQKINSKDYYYIKGQYYKKEYLEDKNYNNISVDLWGNYTYQLTEKVRNKWLLTLRRKNYFTNEDNTYNLGRIKYQIDYKQNDKHQYRIYFQHQRKFYPLNKQKDNYLHKLSARWMYDVMDNLEVATEVNVDQVKFHHSSDSTNKTGKNISFSFKLDI